MVYFLKHIKHTCLLLIIAFSINLLNAQQLDSYSILLTGNTSELQPNSVLMNKWQKTSTDFNELAFLMLGNIYNTKESKFSTDLFLKNNHPLLLAPGEKEWANGSSLGKEVIKNIEKKLKKEYKGNIFMPDAACPGPTEVVLNDNLVVILIDTYWWVHQHERRFKKCGIEVNDDVLIWIEDAIRRHYATKHIVIASHNSLKSFGNGDGYFSMKQSILEAPYTLFRKTLGTRNDNHHPDFKPFRDKMLSILKNYPDIIYASAGDTNLQYFLLDKVHHIISGAMVKTSYVHPKLPEFGSSEKGFAQLVFSQNGKCELVFIGLEGALFKKVLYQKKFNSDINNPNSITHFPDSITVKAGDEFIIPKVKHFLLGKNYRDIWNTPIKAPVFDLKNMKDSLFVVKRGGGKQTLSLRLENKNGKQYVLRSVKKNIEPILPDLLRNTFAIKLVQGQVSTSNPYAALVVAKLAEYAEIYHTNPKIVYVPDDTNFGIYRQDVANQLFLFEERPNGNRDDVASFGYSKKIISSEKMLNAILKNIEYSVDSKTYIRARLLDILINDWDRHEDQWRWASFNDNEKVLYKPIPRDRDQAFFLNDGLIGKISTRKWLTPKFQLFDEYTENVEGLSFNARLLDRNLLIQNEWKDWQAQIDSLKILLTDKKVDDAVTNFPKETQALCANQTAQILKSRLDNLEPMARQLYLFLAKEVSLTGSDSDDVFEIDVHDKATISISRFNNENKIYTRKFNASETKIIHLYGFDGKDKFIIKGHNKNNIKLTIIGGNGKDKVLHETTKTPRFISIYDKNNTRISPSVKNRLKSNYDKNELKYNRENFKYDVVYPSLFTGYNQDDGIFIGGGPVIDKFSRYHHQHYEILANYALKTNAFNIHFAGKKSYPLNRFEASFNADYSSPNYVNNYFGMGNETEWLVDKSEDEYYRVTMSEVFANTNFSKFLDDEKVHKVGLGLFYKYTDIDETSGRFISDYTQNNLVSDNLLAHSFAGISLNYEINTYPQKIIKQENKFGGSALFPTRGSKIETQISQFINIKDNSSGFTKLSGEWTSYLSFSNRPRIVYAFRFGGEKLFGDYAFTEAAKLGQGENLRGYRKTRFYGDASLFLNAEMRVRVKDFKSYILNGTAGFLVFNDTGRVWLEDEDSSRWHNGFGGGLWWTPFDMALVSISYAGSREENLINVSLNYQF